MVLTITDNGRSSRHKNWNMPQTSKATPPPVRTTFYLVTCRLISTACTAVPRYCDADPTTTRGVYDKNMSYRILAYSKLHPRHILASHYHDTACYFVCNWVLKKVVWTFAITDEKLKFHGSGIRFKFLSVKILYPNHNKS